MTITDKEKEEAPKSKPKGPFQIVKPKPINYDTTSNNASIAPNDQSIGGQSNLTA